jgi:hypothetical protein
MSEAQRISYFWGEPPQTRIISLENYLFQPQRLRKELKKLEHELQKEWPGIYLHMTIERIARKNPVEPGAATRVAKFIIEVCLVAGRDGLKEMVHGAEAAAGGLILIKARKRVEQFLKSVIGENALRKTKRKRRRK